ncbi:MAG: hypothetical protein IKR35_07995, partial [Lachnospiraceae bacterium]|nr:hypothetical protein [Lachnospiraceae bacterium]
EYALLRVHYRRCPRVAVLSANCVLAKCRHCGRSSKCIFIFGGCIQQSAERVFNPAMCPRPALSEFEE